MEFNNLLSPLRLRGMELKSRAIFPGMKTNMNGENSFVTQQLIDYHAARAAGGCGLNIVEAASVHEPTAPRQFLSLSDDRYIPGMRALCEAIHMAGGKASIQLWQGGIIPSQYDPERCEPFYPNELYSQRPQPSKEQIAEVVRCFGEAAARAVRSGFDSVEFHCGHAYSPHAFLSPAINSRTDEYGSGAEDGYMRYPLECVEAIRANIPEDMPLFMRVSVQDDFFDNGYDLEYMIRFLKKAKALGVDVADCSRGNFFTEAVDFEVPSVELERGFNVQNAARVRRETGLVTMAVGRINDPEQAESILASGYADLVTVGRGQIADPQFINKCRDGSVCELVRCIGCNQGCYDSILMGNAPITCLQNPAVGKEYAFKAARLPSADAKRVLVIGGGMGGMQAAEIIKARGNETVLCEMDDHLGGQFIMAGEAPSKGEFKVAAAERGERLRRQGVDIRLNTRVDATMLEEFKPDAVVIATGAGPIIPPIPGHEQAHVTDTVEVLNGRAKLSGSVVIIGGGMVGLEVAEYIAARGGVESITVLEQQSQCGVDIGVSRRNGMMSYLKSHGVKLMPKFKCVEITADKVIAEGKRGVKELPADSVVIAVGSGSRDYGELKEAAESRGITYHVIGDAVQPRRAINATSEAAAVAMEI